MRFFIVYYEYKYNPGKVYSVRVPVVGNDPEYSWRMSPLNVPHTNFVKAEEERVDCVKEIPDEAADALDGEGAEAC